MYKKILFTIIMCIGLLSHAQLKTKTLKVKGVCGMCKERIENAANELPSTNGTWNVASKILTISFDESQTSLEKIASKIAEVGHDNELYLANEEVYESLPACCLYDREVPWEDLTEQSDEGEHHLNNHQQNNKEEHHNNLETSNQSVQLEETNVQGSVAATRLDRDAAGLTLNISDKELLKAACCNLSESFETNATVDVAYANAVSGTKQLKMLGLDQKYTLFTKELLPEIRGLATAYGLQFIPGRWIQGIQLTKGGSSVTNGYEALTGHINTELYKFDKKAKTSLNFFANANTRIEANIVHNNAINDKWNQTFLLHGNATINRQDNNNDGFMDQPIGKQFNGTYLINYNDLINSGIGSHFGINFLNDNRLGGQMNFRENKDKLTTNAYGLGIDISRFQVWNKTGYIFPGRPYQSLGLMNQFTYHQQNSYFGLKSYEGIQKTYYSNLIFESIFGATDHQYKTGVSFLYDVYDEEYLIDTYKRKEIVPGAFFEYTYAGKKLTVVLGSRLDFHNLAGTQFTPRLNVKYNIAPKTTLRGSLGRGFRTANIFAESQAYFASNRIIEIIPNNGKIYDLEPETAWNYGISLQQEFKLFGRKSSLVVDAFKTDFTNKVVLDLDDSPQKILFYNLEGKSYANSLQVQWDFLPAKRLEARLAYKYYEVKTEYLSGLKQIPFTPNHRGFANLSYATQRKTNGTQWSFDTTLQWVGEQRLPNTNSNPIEHQLVENSPSYFLLNAQVSHNLNKTMRVYFGGENLLSYTQSNPIVDVNNPFSNYFDGGMVYAPIMPANVYIGLDIDF